MGDGVTDDLDAIIKAHEFANLMGYKVCANQGATYYIGGSGRTAEIQTDTDWGNAKFIIDNTQMEDRTRRVFRVTSKLPSINLEKIITTLKKNQKKLNLTFPHDSFVIVLDETTMRFFRPGTTQAEGSPQVDVFVIDRNGNVDPNNPIIWDYDNISSIIAYPIEEETLTISGGYFSTIANLVLRSNVARGIMISRSNVIVDGLNHVVTGETSDSAPASGILNISSCANVLIQNSTFFGRLRSESSYDINVSRSTNVTFKNCKQANSIHDTNRWGIFGSNECKNLIFDTVEFSRFDAHRGVTNATIKNSSIGHHGIQLIGFGTFLIEDSKLYGSNIITFRSDYGSTFNGDVIIRNCEFTPRNNRTRAEVTLIGGSNTGDNYFGYTCYMPRRIIIDGLKIIDLHTPDGYQGPRLFASFNSANTSASHVDSYPIVVTEEVIINNLTIESGQPLIVSINQYMFRNVRVIGYNNIVR